MSITDESFALAQEKELENWIDFARDSRRIIHELSEHSDPAGPARRLPGRTFQRGLDVGVGCFGLGFLGVHLADLVTEITGLDPLPRIELDPPDLLLRQYVNGIRARVNYVQAKAESIPLPDAYCDLAACINVVDHAQDPPRILREIDRVLAPGGILIFGVNTLSLLGQIKWRIMKRLQPGNWLYLAHPHDYRWRTADALVHQIDGEILWLSNASFRKQLAGHGGMSFWIIRKSRR